MLTMYRKVIFLFTVSMLLLLVFLKTSLTRLGLRPYQASLIHLSKGSEDEDPLVEEGREVLNPEFKTFRESSGLLVEENKEIRNPESSTPHGNAKPLGEKRMVVLSPEIEEPNVKATLQPLWLQKLPCFDCNRYNCEVPKGVRSLVLAEGPVVPTATNVTPEDATIVIHNRVNKCGSSTMKLLVKRLRKILSYDVKYSLPRDRTMTRVEQKKQLENFHKNRRHKNLVFLRHMTYFNVTRFDHERVIWTNIVRNPVDRYISYFHFVRSLCKGTEVWRSKDLNDCVKMADPECLPQEGKMKLLQLTYFCGEHPACWQVGNRDALQRAKRHVENYYSVVGVLEHLTLSFRVMENYIPKFFKGLTELYGESPSSKGVKRNSQKKKPEIFNKTRELLAKALKEDIEFYDFIKQRLFLQAKAVGLEDMISE